MPADRDIIGGEHVDRIAAGLTACQVRPRFSETSTVGGCIDTVVKLLAVMPTAAPSAPRLVTTVTPVEKREAAARKLAASG